MAIVLSSFEWQHSMLGETLFFRKFFLLSFFEYCLQANYDDGEIGDKLGLIKEENIFVKERERERD